MEIKGLLIDDETRCKHYHSPMDIVAIKFKCCNIFYPCYECHEVFEDHKVERWKVSEFKEEAILCGSCKKTLSIQEYIQTGHCSHCKSLFNPKCSYHYHLYFEE